MMALFSVSTYICIPPQQQKKISNNRLSVSVRYQIGSMCIIHVMSIWVSFTCCLYLTLQKKTYKWTLFFRSLMPLFWVAMVTQSCSKAIYSPFNLDTNIDTHCYYILLHLKGIPFMRAWSSLLLVLMLSIIRDVDLMSLW